VLIRKGIKIFLEKLKFVIFYQRFLSKIAGNWHILKVKIMLDWARWVVMASNKYYRTLLLVVVGKLVELKM